MSNKFRGYTTYNEALKYAFNNDNLSSVPYTGTTESELVTKLNTGAALTDNEKVLAENIHAAQIEHVNNAIEYLEHLKTELSGFGGFALFQQYDGPKFEFSKLGDKITS